MMLRESLRACPLEDMLDFSELHWMHAVSQHDHHTWPCQGLPLILKRKRRSSMRSWQMEDSPWLWAANWRRCNASLKNWILLILFFPCFSMLELSWQAFLTGGFRWVVLSQTIAFPTPQTLNSWTFYLQYSRRHPQFQDLCCALNSQDGNHRNVLPRWSHRTARKPLTQIGREVSD